jgi:cellulose synthase operon protein C
VSQVIDYQQWLSIWFKVLLRLALLMLLLIVGAFTTAFAANNSNTHAEMLRSARMWEAKDRPDLARTMLEKALLINEDPEVLLMLASIELRSRNTNLAAKYLQKLEQRFPNHPNTRAVRNLYRVYTTQNQTLARLRLMARAGKADDAASAMLQLFPDGPPPEELGLEYYQIVGNTSQGQQSAMAGLAKRFKETGEARYRLAWLKLKGNRNDLPESLRDYESLAAMPDVNKTKLRENWWSALKNLPAEPASLLSIRHFLHEFPDDQKAIILLTDLQQSKEFTADQKTFAKLTNDKPANGKSSSIKQHKDETAPINNDPATQSRETGLAFIEQGLFEEAQRELQKTLLIKPNDAQALGGMGLIRLRQGMQEEALTWFGRASSIEPNSNKWRSLINTASFWHNMKQADGLLDAGKLQEAQLAAQQALDIDANHADALALLGNILSVMNKQNEAEQLYKKALKQNANNNAAMRGMLALLVRSERHQEALALVADYRIKNPAQAALFSEAQARLLRDDADAYLMAHRPTHALQALETAILLAPNDAWIRYDLANMYKRLGLPAIGLRVMAEGAKLAPDDEEMNYAYALVLTAQESEEEALLRLARIPITTKTKAMNELETRAWINVHSRNAKQLFLKGKFEEATGEMLLAEQRAIGQPNAIEQVAEGWFGLDQPGRAIALMKQSLVDKKIAEASSYLYYASMLNRAKQDDSLKAFLSELYQRSDWTEGQLERLLAIETDASVRQIEHHKKLGEDAKALAIAAQMPVFGKAGEVTTLKSRARMLMAAEDVKSAIPLLKAILQAQANDIDAQLSLAWAYNQAGNKQSAQDSINQLLSHLPENDVDTQLSVARLALSLGNIAQSRQLVAALLARHPNNPEVLMQAGYVERSDKQYNVALAYFRQVKALGANVVLPNSH